MKIGDIWVKLGLKKDEYSKGMKEAGNQASSFVNKLNAIGAKGKVVFAAVAAAVVGVAAAIKDLAKQNQFLGDTLGRFSAGMTAMFDTLKTSIASLDFSHLISDLIEANRLARDLYDAQDAMGEINTGYNISLAQQLKHINELRVALRDQNLSDEERIKKGEELLAIYKKLEQNPTRGLGRVKDTTLDYYMQRMGVNMENRTDAQLASMRKQYLDFFKWLGTKQGENALSAAEAINKTVIGKQALQDTYLANAQRAGFENYARLALTYSAKMSDDDRLAIEKAVVGYYKQEAKYSEETFRIQTQINSIKAQQANKADTDTSPDPGLDQAEKVAKRAEDSAKSEVILLMEKYQEEKALLEKYQIDTMALWDEYSANVKAALGKLFDVKLTPEIKLDFELDDIDLSDVDAEIQQFIANFQEECDLAREIMEEFRDTAIQGFTDGLQELTDQLMGLSEVNPGRIVQALMEPLADLAIKEGEILVATGIGVEACKEALESLQGPAAIAAGLTLIAIGTAAKSGLAALAKSGGASTSATTYSGSSGSANGTQNFQTEMTINVKGTIRGSDIVLAGQKTVNNWQR